ncbi:SDR family oxidoreductase [Serratia fonticola]|uniref:SDR family NAD(P)-dependent oxidoreductase n=1 Tax=Serratia fonticola TaxID=47917 RepID=UPI0015C58AC7|nr:SDR family NAD(P)-dependent oxidoreductase [Serratia fonticola]MBC3380656.1 SDR family oxidoreductase [Serratia fonticola]NYA39855.1 SDR family oxidoreductase [Serratia fonticola]
MQDFTGKVALVTGASTGIGEAIAQELVDRGAKVAITARNSERLAATAQRIDPTGKSVFPLVMDARDPESVRSAVAQTLALRGQLHLLVNNAGITGPHDVPLNEYPIEDWHAVIETDLSGTFYGMKYGLPAIAAAGGGAVVNLSAVNGMVGIAGIAPYTAAKHGIIGLTRAAALEFADRGIRINAVGPGYVDTPSMAKLPALVREKMAASHPMGRMATREEVAKTVVFLLSIDSSFTTGAFYSIDGGYTAQ